jgi:hypothetical protein
LGDSTLESSDIPHRVCQALVARDSQPEGPPALRIIAEALLSSWGLSVPSLRDFTTEAAEVLNTVPASDAIADLALSEKRVLLHALGLHPRPQLAGYTEVLDFARMFPLVSSRDSLEDLLLRIESLTGYGTRRVTLSEEDLWIQELLAGLAMHFLRKYDFVTGCRLLRAMGYLGVGYGDSFDDCLRFLLLHQRPEGAFGFFGPEESLLKVKAPEGYSLDANLYLPVTLGCLAALAEGTDSAWRVYGSLPQIELLRG